MVSIIDRCIKTLTCSNFSHIAFFTISTICFLIGWKCGGSFFGTFLLVASFLFFLLLAFDVLSTIGIGVTSEKIPVVDRRKNIIDIMMERRSNRSYQKRDIKNETLNEIKECMKEATDPENLIGGKKIRIEHIKADIFALCIRNCREFLVGIVPKDYDDRVLFDIGNALQKVVLKCQKIGVRSCWIGGFRSSETIKFLKEFDTKKEHVAVVIAVGYPSQNLSLGVKFMTWYLRKRKPMSELFFEDEFYKPMKEDDKKFRTVMKCTRRSPSASNSQETFIVREGNVYHFYSYSRFSKFYSKLGAGIYFQNFTAALDYLKIQGNVVVDVPKITVPEGAVYMCSFVMEEM